MDSLHGWDVSYCECGGACERVCCNHCGAEIGEISRDGDDGSFSYALRQAHKWSTEMAARSKNGWVGEFDKLKEQLGDTK